MNGQPLPGMYWDAEKKKYFSIKSAKGMDVKYSQENIQKAERKERIREVATARSNKIRKERVVRRYPHSFAQTHVEREIGSKRRSFYVQNLWPNACASGMDQEPQQVISDQTRVRLFDRDPVSKTLYAVQGSNSILRRRIYCDDDVAPHMRHSTSTGPSIRDLPLDRRYSFHPWDELTRTTSEVTSLCYLPATGALAVTSQGSDRPPEIFLTDPERDGPYIGERFTPPDGATIWAAAARPTTFSPSPGLANTVAASHTEHLAVAVSSSMQLLTRGQTGAWDAQVVVKDLKSDVLALEWISYTTIAFGCRDGKIRLHDTRSGGSSHILTHPNPISKLKRADDETRLVCSGLQDTLFLYDIRSSRPSRSSSRKTFNYEHHHYNDSYFKEMLPGSELSAKRRKLNHKAYKNWSQPVLTFEHANRDLLYLDIDVHPRLGLLAAGQDTSTDIGIRISNIWTGKTVREISRRTDNMEYRGPQQHWAANRTLKFMDRNDADGGVDLWTCWNGGIAKFSWGRG